MQVLCYLNSTSPELAGRLLCAGSSMFLKKRFGIGYLLTILKSATTEENQLTELVKHHVQGAYLSTNVASEISFKLPMQQTQNFASLLRVLEDKQDHFGITGYGLSCSTLEEVFLATATNAHTQSPSATAAVHIDDHLGPSDTEYVGDSTGNDEELLNHDSLEAPLLSSNGTAAVGDVRAGRTRDNLWSFLKHIYCSRVVQQMIGQCTKRLVNIRRDWKGITCILIMPILFILPALWLAHIQSTRSDDPDPTTTKTIHISRDLLNGNAALVGGQVEEDTAELLLQYYPHHEVAYSNPFAHDICTWYYYDCNCWDIVNEGGGTTSDQIACQEERDPGMLLAMISGEKAVTQQCERCAWALYAC